MACSKCGYIDVRFPYNYEAKGYQCPNCKHIEKVLPKRRKCFCGHEYDEYTRFDPSGCPKCYRSFVD